MSSYTTTTKRTCRALVYTRYIDYKDAWNWQRQMVADRSAGMSNDTLLLLEHSPTITLGRSANMENLLVSRAELSAKGIALVESDRGGDITYHGPGQLVGYPILKLRNYGGDLLAYLRKLEEVLIQTLATYNVVAKRIEGLTGVWVEGEDSGIENLALEVETEAKDTANSSTLAKIAAIGIRLSASGITSHGFALNVAPDLQGFAQIIPCGLQGRRVTSLAQILGTPPPMKEVKERVIAAFSQVFQIAFITEKGS